MTNMIRIMQRVIQTLPSSWSDEITQSPIGLPICKTSLSFKYVCILGWFLVKYIHLLCIVKHPYGSPNSGYVHHNNNKNKRAGGSPFHRLRPPQSHNNQVHFGESFQRSDRRKIAFRTVGLEGRSHPNIGIAWATFEAKIPRRWSVCLLS
jgi:hypothetical protein